MVQDLAEPSGLACSRGAELGELRVSGTHSGLVQAWACDQGLEEPARQAAGHKRTEAWHLPAIGARRRLPLCGWPAGRLPVGPSRASARGGSWNSPYRSAFAPAPGTCSQAGSGLRAVQGGFESALPRPIPDSYLPGL